LIAEKEKKKKEGFCYCHGPEVGLMVHCDYCKGKQGWYHNDCLIKIGVVLPWDGDKLKRGTKFKCPACTARPN
jgi:hypothetical protein